MNLSVQTTDEWLATLVKPGIETVAEFKIAPDDWLVICAGFEDRALAVIQSAISFQRPFNVLLVVYEPLLQENKLNTIREVTQRAGIRISEVTYDRQEPARFGSAMVNKLSACQGDIFVNISAMSRLLMVQCPCCPWHTAFRFFQLLRDVRRSEGVIRLPKPKQKRNWQNQNPTPVFRFSSFHLAFLR